MKRKKLSILNATLELTSHMDGAIIIAQLLSGFVTLTEIRLALARNGVSFGILESGISAIAEGSRAQHVVAKAVKNFSPPQVQHLINRALTDADLASVCDEFAPEKLALLQPVEKGQTLLKILEGPAIQIVNPDGSIQAEEKIDMQIGEWVDGANTAFDEVTKMVVASEDGLACYGLMNETIVSPSVDISPLNLDDIESFRSASYLIDSELDTKSSYVVPGNLKITGEVSLERLTVEGCLEGDLFKTHSLSKEPLRISVLQHMVARTISKCAVYCEANLAVTEMVSQSKIEVLKNAGLRDVADSEVNVRGHLYVRNISGSTHIRIGRSFVVSSRYRDLMALLEMNLKTLILIDVEITELREKVELIQGKIKLQLVQARHNQNAGSKARLILRRLYEGYASSLHELERKLQLFELNLDLRLYLQNLIEIYESDLNDADACQVTCTGTIEPGVIISSENQTHTVNRTLQNVQIKVNSALGSFEIISLNEEPSGIETDASQLAQE